MRRQQAGAALGIVMVLLLGLSLLATAGLAGALASLVLSDFDQQRALAFEAAEAAISRSLATGRGIDPPAPPWPALTAKVVAHSELLRDPPGRDESSPDGFSAGHGGITFVLRHQVVRAEAQAGRGAQAGIEQGFVTLAPRRGGMP
jgi:hypothetical protein